MEYLVFAYSSSKLLAVAIIFVLVVGEVGVEEVEVDVERFALFPNLKFELAELVDLGVDEGVEVVGGLLDKVVEALVVLEVVMAFVVVEEVVEGVLSRWLEEEVVGLVVGVVVLEVGKVVVEGGVEVEEVELVGELLSALVVVEEFGVVGEVVLVAELL